MDVINCVSVLEKELFRNILLKNKVLRNMNCCSYFFYINKKFRGILGKKVIFTILIQKTVFPELLDFRLQGDQLNMALFF